MEYGIVMEVELAHACFCDRPIPMQACLVGSKVARE